MPGGSIFLLCSPILKPHAADVFTDVAILRYLLADRQFGGYVYSSGFVPIELSGFSRISFYFADISLLIAVCYAITVSISNFK